MKKKKTTTELFRYFMEGFTGIFLFLMIGIFLFYYHNDYQDIVWAKKNFFQYSAIVLLLFAIVFGIPGLLQKRKAETEKSKRITLTDIFALIFAVTVILSSCMSPAGTEAFWGNEGRRMGGCFLLLCLTAYYIVSRYYKSRQLLIWVFLLANCAMWTLVILNFWGIDLLNIYKNVISDQQTAFIGTMGHININAGYSGVILSLMMVFYYQGKELITKRCFFAAVVLGIYSCLAMRSDSWLLGLCGGYIIILIFAMKNKETLKKWWMLCLAFFCGSLGMRLTVWLEDAAGWSHACVQDLKAQSFLWEVLLNEKVLLAELIILALLWLLFRSPGVHFLNKYGNIIVFSCLALVIIVSLIIIFPLEDSFGTNRGYIWKRTILNFKEFPFWQKLIGYGPNCFLQSMEERFGAEMRERYVNPFIDAHNEALQFLTVTGILGVVSYFGMQISLLVSCVKSRKENTAALLGCAGILAYILQGLVNNPQVFTTPLFFIFLGIIHNKIITSNKRYKTDESD